MTYIIQGFEKREVKSAASMDLRLWILLSLDRTTTKIKLRYKDWMLILHAENKKDRTTPKLIDHPAFSLFSK